MKKLIYGTEPYCVDNEVKKIISGIDAMNIARFESLSKEAINVMEQYPFLAERQAVIIETDKFSADDVKTFEALSVPDFTVLVVVAKSVDTRTNAYKALGKKGCVAECKKVDADTLKKLVMRLVETKGSSMSDEVFSFFLRHIGYELDENVTLYTVNIAAKQLCFSTDVITENEVRALVPQSFTTKIWELSNLLLDQNGKALFELAERLLQEKETGVGMLSMLLRSFRLAYKATLLKGQPEARITKALGVPAYQYKAAMRFTSKQVSEILTILQEGVNDIKSGADDRWMVFLTLGNALCILGGAT